MERGLVLSASSPVWLCLFCSAGRKTGPSCHNYACIAQCFLSRAGLVTFLWHATPHWSERQNRTSMVKTQNFTKQSSKLAAKLYFICGINSFPNSPSVLSTFSIPSLTTSGWSHWRNVKSKSDHYRGLTVIKTWLICWLISWDLPRWLVVRSCYPVSTSSCHSPPCLASISLAVLSRLITISKLST